jgi:hypothetical protein
MTDKIRAALETHLNAMSPAIATAWENTPFDPAKDVAPGQPYQEVNLLVARPDNRYMGCDRRIEQGILQVTLKYPIGKGSAPSEARANLIIAHFKRSTKLVSGGQWVQVIRTPAKRVLGADGAVFKIVVSINWQADVFG